MDGLTGAEGPTEPTTPFEREYKTLHEERVLGILNRAAAVCLAIGTFYLFYGIAISATDVATLGINAGLRVAIEHVGQLPLALIQIVIGLALILAIKKQSRLKIALITIIVVSGCWTALSVVPAWLGLTEGISPTGIALWASFGSVAAYSLLKVLRIDKDFSDLWVSR